MVQRLNASLYFADDLLGLSEAQVYDAITVTLESDREMGRSLAAFAFTSLAISSRGVPLSSSDSFYLAGQFSFSIFGMLAASGFLCGLTAAVFADIMLRQFALTNTKE